MRSQAESPRGRADRRQRQHLMERSFARGTRYGIKRARWRRLWRVSIQEYLTATIQNIMILLRHYNKPLKAVPKRVEPAASLRSLIRTAYAVSGRRQCTVASHRPSVRLSSARFRASFGQQPVDS